MPMVLSVFPGVIEKMSVAAPSPVGFALGALPGQVPLGFQLVVVSQAVLLELFQERTVWP